MRGHRTCNRVWLKDGSGNFTDSGQNLGDHKSYDVALGDLDGDGDLDAVIANIGQGNRVWLNDESGNFTDSGQSLGNHDSSNLALGDVDGDGDLDAFVANTGFHGNRVWLNQDPPQVTGVLVTGTAWNPVFLDQLEAVGSGGTRGYAIPVGNSAQLNAINWVNVDQLIFRFSEQVNVDQADLVLSGVLGPDGVENANNDYSFSAFRTETGPNGEFQAVWTLSSPLGIDKLLIKLDGTTASAVTDLTGNTLNGEWTNESSTFPSGTGSTGGNFNFAFRSLPGDVNNSDTVDALDEAQVDAPFISVALPSFGAYSVFNDLNGDAFIVSNDVLFTRARNGNTLPASAPSGPATVSSSSGSGGTFSSTALPKTITLCDQTDPPVATGDPPTPSAVDVVGVEDATVVDDRNDRVVDVLAAVDPLRYRTPRIGNLRELPEGSPIGLAGNATNFEPSDGLIVLSDK